MHIDNIEAKKTLLCQTITRCDYSNVCALDSGVFFKP